jgi:Zn-dependent protease
VLLHEFGHALAARRFGIGTKDIVLLPIGGVARLERMPDRPGQEFWIAVAGPAVNVVIAAALAVGLTLAGGWAPLSELSTTQGSFAERLLVVNVFLVLFNLLPAFPMDGGRVLRALLAMRFDYLHATAVAARIGQATAVLFGMVGALMMNPLLVLIALFVWTAAAGEAGLVRVKWALRGVTAGAAMRTEFGTLAPGDPLELAAGITVRHGQAHLPVLTNGQVVGLLTRSDLMRSLTMAEADRTVADVMNPRVETVDPSEPLDEVFTRLQQEPGKTLLVVEGGRLIGLLGLDDIVNLLSVRHAAAQRQSRRSAGMPA